MATEQPKPIPNGSKPSWELVIEDMRERNRIGTERYGTPLQPGNGRDSLWDAYEESLDKTVYLRNEIEERRRMFAIIAPALDRIARLVNHSIYMQTRNGEQPRLTVEDRSDLQTLILALGGGKEIAPEPKG